MFGLGNNIQIVLFIGIFLVGVFTFLGYFLGKVFAEKKFQITKAEAKKIIDQAKKEAEQRHREIELEAKDLLYRLRQDFDRETKERREEMHNLEKRLTQREENVERRYTLLEGKEREYNAKARTLETKDTELKSKETELNRILTEEKERLQKISGLSSQEAKDLLLSRIEKEVTQEKAQIFKKAEEEIKEVSAKKAQEIIALAIQKCSADHTVESTVSVVNLPSDEMKGRIIGREGRNIRALEMATGVDVIIDDTPEAVTLSGFDPVRREVAKLTLEKLISDGRIHPGRIEEVADKVRRELEDKIREEGERTLFDVGIHGLHPELVKLLGKLKYRTSFGQNALQHSKEVAYLMGVMASELNLDLKLAKRVGILHDIGKAIDHQVEGTHARIGAELAKKYGEENSVVHAIEAHHEEQEPQTLYAILSVAADAISAARPGARRETLESYVRRLEKLEAIAQLFKGVDRAYAIQAGREIRVIVQPEKISDEECTVLSRDIRKKIEEGMEYPGQIKITVIRETRAIEYAK